MKSIKLDKSRHHWASIHSTSPPAGNRPSKRPRLSSNHRMDSSFASTTSASSRSLYHGHPPRTSSSQSVRARGDNVGDGSGPSLFRGHSDGDMLERRQNETSRRLMGRTSGGQETWMDFVREPSGGRQDAFEQAMAARRAATIAADRRRRLSQQQEEQMRRRASRSLSFVHPSGERSILGSQSNVPGTAFTEPMLPPNIASPSTQRPMDRPLPRVPSMEISRDPVNRDIALPKWQADTEVSKCPICETAFSFWYRKHHCRKCGRVVCGNCSPHRITIPRQFIVHPPEESAASPPTSARNSGIEVVDLTEENDSGDDAHPPIERPQSSDYKIDPALGGGQEVRLCNPCVPDPNPLPHVPFFPQNLSLHGPFPGSSRVSSRSQNSQHPQISISPSLVDGRARDFSRRASQGQPHDRHESSRSDGRFTLRESFDYPDTVASRRNGPPFRDANASGSPPGYSSIYGSAPDQSTRRVSRKFPHLTDDRLNIDMLQHELAALLQANAPHRHHRHHASMGNFPTPFQNRQPGEYRGPSSRPAPTRPQLREEDECPICHQALPPKGPDNSEVAREAHVQSCIETHFSSSGPRSSDPPPSAAPGAAVALSTATPAQAAGARPVPMAHRASTGANDRPSASFQRRRVAGMLVYHASEKDCVGEDGEGAQECVICFEEFAVGDEMGRLECLCKFHKVRFSAMIII